MLADDVLHGPALARRCAFVIENADGRAVVDERLEQDRAGVRDDARGVLEDRGQHVEVREARLLDVNARNRERSREALLPCAVAWMRPEQKRHASATLRLPPPNDSLDEAILEGRVRRRVSHDDDERERRVEVE